jgi:hypothetical protein
MLAVTSLLAAAPAAAAVLPLAGAVLEVDASATGVEPGDALSGTIEFDRANPLGGGRYAVTRLELTLPGGVSLTEFDAIGPLIATVEPLPGVLDAWLVVGDRFGGSGLELFAGNLSPGGDATFQISDPFGTAIASGSLAVTPIPAALPLLGAGLAGLVLLRRFGAR